jgi:hypothetical protein
MNEFPIRKWPPRSPSSSLSRRIFKSKSSDAGANRLRIPWIRTGLVVISVWMCALTVAWSPEATFVDHPPRGEMWVSSTVVAQNRLPATSFILTNQPIFPVTNASRSAL